MSKHFEIVIFTAALKEYADWILDTIDSFHLISHRLYRQHTTPHQDYAIKDLAKLGRPMNKLLLVDNLAENYVHTTPCNGITIPSWYEDMDDTALELLGSFLKQLAVEKYDVRKVLKKEVREYLYECMETGEFMANVEEIVDWFNNK